jgi:hypothetical protein
MTDALIVAAGTAYETGRIVGFVVLGLIVVGVLAKMMRR